MNDRESVDRDKRTTLRRFAALGAVSPVAGLLDGRGASPPGAESDARRAILGYLSTTPGAHFSKIRDDLGLGTGETQHHLGRLEDRGAVESFTDGEYRRYVPAGRFSSFERLALGYLRRRTPRRLVVAVLLEPEISGTDLAERLDVSRSTVSRTISELESVGLLVRDGSIAVTRPETVITLLVRYAESFDAETVAFADRASEVLRYRPEGGS